MMDLIEAILSGAAAGISGRGASAPTKRAGSGWLGLAIGLLSIAGTASSVYAMFFQAGNLWQIGKLLLLAMLLLLCAMGGFFAFHQGRQRRLRRRRIALGQCPRCGYDFRGNPSPTCPECGNELLPPGTILRDPTLPVG